MPISIGKVQGDEDSISAALKKNGQKKLVMIVRTLAGSAIYVNDKQWTHYVVKIQGDYFEQGSPGGEPFSGACS